MVRRQCSSRVCQGRGGWWFRLPRPRPPSLEQPEAVEDASAVDTALPHDEEYDSCSDGGEEVYNEALLAAAGNVVLLLREAGESAAAGVVQAVCAQLEAQVEAHNRLENRYNRRKEKLKAARAKVTAQENLKGQSLRWWRKSERLQRQLHEGHVWRWHGRQYPP